MVAGSLWWQNEANKEQREGIVRALESKSDDKIDDEEFKRRCDEIFNKNMQKCIELGQEHGSDRFRACKESAWTQYAQCLSGKPKENWRGLQVK